MSVKHRQQQLFQRRMNGWAALAEIVFVRIPAHLGALLAVLPSARMLRHCAGRYRLPS
jgi:hypothetical protein